jgi:carnitine-CoA ligase
MRYAGEWTIGALIDDRAERWPGETAILAPEGDLTYGALRDRAQRVAGGLQRLGVQPGDRVATMLDSTVDYLAAWHGVVWAGAIDTPINTELRATFLEHVLRDCGARVLITQGRWLDRLERLNVPGLEHVVTIGERRGEPAVTLHEFADLLAGHPVPLVARAESDPVYILYTSGTTGPSKGVTYSNRSASWLSQGYIEALDLDHHDVGYSMFPLFHTMGRSAMVTTGLFVRCPIALRSRFSVSGFWDDIRATGSTFFGYFGAVILFLWREPERADDAENPVRVAFGAAAPPELAEGWERRFGLTLTEVYGSTELGLAAIPRVEEVRHGTMGRPVAHLELAIHHADDQPAPAGQVGEIVARPRQPYAMFSAYWGRPEETLHAFRNLWFHSGDAGSLDEDGYITFVDRIKDSIRRRGENISSFEVEEAVRSMESVVECAAYPVPSEHGEDEVMIAVVPVDKTSFDAEAFCRALIPLMPRFAVPRYIRLLDELPKTPTQRVQKFKLRADGVTADTVDREALGIIPVRD